MPPRPVYPDDWTVRRARDEYFARNGFSEAGYQERWVRLALGPLAVYFPNTEGRRRAVRLHDLHHIATGYDTSLTGEAEIGAWEVGAGCSSYFAAWVLNGTAAAFGLFFAPRRVLAAFRRGRRSRTLYLDVAPRAELPTELLDRSVADLRRQLGLAPT